MVSNSNYSHGRDPMKRIFSNGPAKDYVFNPLTRMMHRSTRLCIAAPYVTETGDLLSVSKSGTSVDLLIGLNASTSPEALSLVHGQSNIAIRYLTHRFHAKIYISDSAAMVGSSNLTDGGLRSNREATILLDQPDDLDAIEELRLLFLDLWNSGQVLTDEKLKRFTEAWHQAKRAAPNLDALIENAVGRAEPVNINVASSKKVPERIFLEQLRRQVYEQYRPSFNEGNEASRGESPSAARA